MYTTFSCKGKYKKAQYELRRKERKYVYKVTAHVDNRVIYLLSLNKETIKFQRNV